VAVGGRCLNSSFQLASCVRLCLLSSSSGLIPPSFHLRYARELWCSVISRDKWALPEGRPAHHRSAQRLLWDFYEESCRYLSKLHLKAHSTCNVWTLHILKQLKRLLSHRACTGKAAAAPSSPSDPDVPLNHLPTAARVRGKISQLFCSPHLGKGCPLTSSPLKKKITRWMLTNTRALHTPKKHVKRLE